MVENCILFFSWFFPGLGIRSFQKNISFSRSFPFSTKERFILYVHFHSVQKNVSFSTFISVQCKRTFRSLRSFLFCKKNVSFILVWLGPKNVQKRPFWGQKWFKKGKKNSKIKLNVLKMNETFISVHYKWTIRSLHLFPFSTKECFVLYVHFRSIEKNVSFSTFISVL